MLLVLRTSQQWMVRFLGTLRQAIHHRPRLVRVRPRANDTVLGTSKLSRCHHAHGTSDLPDVPY